VVRAWRPDGTGFVIDYGVHEVHGTVYGSDEGLDVALKRGILAPIEATKETEYLTTDGKQMPVELTLVDAGFRTQAVYGACAEVGLGVKPIMGFGKSSGCTQANFSDVQAGRHEEVDGAAVCKNPSPRCRMTVRCELAGQIHPLTGEPGAARRPANSHHCDPDR
jgi:hypothetical protein